MSEGVGLPILWVKRRKSDAQPSGRTIFKTEASMLYTVDSQSLVCIWRRLAWLSGLCLICLHRGPLLFSALESNYQGSVLTTPHLCAATPAYDNIRSGRENLAPAPSKDRRGVIFFLVFHVFSPVVSPP